MQFTMFLGACECVWLLYHGWIVYTCVVVCGLDRLSPLGVWDVLGGWTHDGHGTG